MDVDSVPAGARLDALVATKIMGLPHAVFDEKTSCPNTGEEMRFCGQRSWCSVCGEWHHSPYKEYSEGLEAGWDVFLNMMSRSYSARQRFFHELRKLTARPDGSFVEWPDVLDVLKDRFPEAVCRAALKAMDDEPYAGVLII